MSDQKRVDDLQPHDRRGFFLASLIRAVRPMADILEQKLPVPKPRTVIRPPGAVDEDTFLETCHRCGNCITACPAGAIRQVQSSDSLRSGTPYIDPDLAPCVVCEECACMKACTSGALKLVRHWEFNMGLARLNPTYCLLTFQQHCEVCLQKCPVGSSAIRLNESKQVEVIEKGCVGCGVCQHHCPAVPKALLVSPE